jgi:signal transduction histidine kinase
MATIKTYLLGLMRSNVKVMLGTALAYAVLAELSRRLASTPNSVTPVWPPDGLAVGMTLLYGKPALVGVFVGSFLANLRAFWSDLSPVDFLLSILAVVGIAAGTTIGTQLGAILLKKHSQSRYPFARVSDAVKFLAYTGLIGPTINATVGVSMLIVASKIQLLDYPRIWVIWWISNVAGIFILTPLILSCKQWLEARNPSLVSPLKKQFHLRIWLKLFGRKKFEFGTLILLILVVGKVAFWNNYPIAYILIPLLVWAAFRFGGLGATLSTFAIATLAILGTVRGLGSFASNDLNQSLIGLQSFIAVIVFTSLILVAVLSEQSEAKTQLKQAFTDLQLVNGVLEEQAQDLALKNYQLEYALEELKVTQAQMVQSEKMSALGNLVAGVAHEINNPLGFLNGSIQNAKDHAQDLFRHIQLYQKNYPNPVTEIEDHEDYIDLDFLNEDLPHLLQSMEEATNRIKRISVSLRTFTRADTDRKVLANVEENLDSTLLILKYRLKGTNNRPEIKVSRQYAQLPKISCFPGQLNQVFMNVLANAIDALDEASVGFQFANPENRRYQITIRTVLENDRIAIYIADTGNGMDEFTQSKIFDRLFTTKGVDQGTGLGLSIARQIIVDKHGGTIDVSSELHRGTEFCIRLPIDDPELG